MEVGRGLLVFTEPLGTSLSGRYLELHVTERLGGGGFSDVFRIERVLPEKFETAPMALKVLKGELLANGQALYRFRREADFLARVSHPNVVRVYGFGRLGTTFFILEELIEGASLRAVLQERQVLTVLDAVRVALQIASGLSALHEAGLVHRDLKPENLVRDREGRIVIVDFGIAHAGDVTRFTETGAFVGTAAYAAPEQLLGGPPTVQTDIYALGVILFEFLTGQRPHLAAFVPALIRAKNLEDPRSVTSLVPRVSPALAALTMALLARDPAERPSSAREVQSRLERELESCENHRLPEEELEERSSTLEE